MTELDPRLTFNPRSPRLNGIVALIVIVLVFHAFRSLEFEQTFSPAGQWDFESYYYALMAYRQGADPYDTDALKTRAGHAVFPFVYPHHTLRFFALFDRGELQASKNVFLAAKAVVLCLLLLLWTMRFVPRGARGWFVAFAVLGLNAAVPRDLTAGNVSLFEIGPIWLGIAALSLGYPVLFCVGIILGAQFKVQPLLLLALLWFHPVSRRAACLGASLAVVALIGAGVYVSDPAAAEAYVFHSTRMAGGEAGLSNPSGLKFITQLVGMAMDPYGVFESVDRRTIGRWAYSVYALVIVLLTMRTLPKDRSDSRWIHLGVVTYVLIAPRMKDYSWVLALPSVFELGRLALRRPATLVPGVLLLLVFLAVPLRDALWTYRPYVLTLVVWAATVFAPVSADSEVDHERHEPETDVRGSVAAP